jgi:5-hydroxyisourate hydrolase-like protein (transthyretin family)
MFRFLILLVPLFAAACDPCGGIGLCGAPQVRYDGELLRRYPAGPADGIRVDFVRSGGAALESDVLTAETDRSGRFRLQGEARDEGVVVGTLRFHPPAPLEPVRIEGVRLTTTRAAGEARFAGSWSIELPHLPYEAHFYHRRSGLPAAGIEIEFRRTGGIRVEPDTFRVTTDAWGNVKLTPITREVGEVTGELIVYPLPPFRPYAIPGVKMSTFTTPRADSTVVRSGIGPHLPYAGVLVWEGTGTPAAGVELEFRRTAGVSIHPDPFVTLSDGFGTFHVNPTPLELGAVEGDLVVRSLETHAGHVLRHLRLPVIEGEFPIQNMGPFTLPDR